MLRKLFSKKFYYNKYVQFVNKLNWSCLYWQKARIYYKNRTGKILNYNNPQDINQKLMWLTRYWQHPLKTKCADKFLVREYIKEKHLEHILVPLYGVYNTTLEIDFDKLPNQFVLKCNHGCGFNIICLNKNDLNYEQTINTLNKWMNTDFSERSYQIHYKNIPRKIVCEKLISNKSPIEYQFWCLNGEIDSILVCRKNFDGSYNAYSYSLKWIQLYERIGEIKNTLFSQPKNLDLMVQYAKILSQDFPFVRVDLYNVDEVIYLAELTFTPAANILSSYKTEFLDRLGNKLKLPKKYKKTTK